MQNVKIKMLLQLFAEGGEPQDPPADPKAPQDPPQDPKAPFAVFPDKESFMARVNREARKQSKEAVGNLLKELGIENEDALKGIISAYNDAQAKNQTELDKVKEQLKKAQEDNTKYAKALVLGKKTDAVKSIATELGVDAKKIGRFSKFIDLDAVNIDKDGNVDIEDLKGTIQGILDEFPEFKGVIPPTTGGGKPFQGGKGPDEPKALTIDDIKKMSTKEVQEHWEEVQKVLYGGK